MRNILIALALFLTSVPSLAEADVILEGKKALSYCVKLENVADYSEYMFVLYEGGPLDPSYQVFTPNNCLSFYEASSPKIYAIAKTTFDPNVIGDDVKGYFEEGEDVILAEAVVSDKGQVDEEDSRERIVALYEIQSVDDSAVTVRLKAEQAFDADGRLLATGTPSPSTTASVSPRPQPDSAKGLRWFQDNWSVALPVAGSIVIGLIIVINIARKRPTEVVVEQPPDEQSPSGQPRP